MCRGPPSNRFSKYFLLFGVKNGLKSWKIVPKEEKKRYFITFCLKWLHFGANWDWNREKDVTKQKLRHNLRLKSWKRYKENICMLKRLIWGNFVPNILIKNLK